MKEQTKTFSGAPPPVFTIHSHYPEHYHEAMLTSPFTASVAIFCPWPRTDEPPTLEQKSYIIANSQSVTKYLINEGIMDNSLGGIGVSVFTKHPTQKI